MDFIGSSSLPSVWEGLRNDLWPHWLYFQEVDSTNNIGKEILKHNPQPTVILAEMQTAGRGRLGRDWFSPTGSGLWFSVVLSVTAFTRNVLPILSGYALWQTFQQYGMDIQLKWPNDLWLQRKKCGGILCEMVSQTPDWAVLGVGINFYQEIFPTSLMDIATSIQLATNCRIERSDFLQTFLAVLVSDLNQPQIKIRELAQKWPHISAFYQQPIRIVRRQKQEMYREKGLAEDGSLIVEQHGLETRITSGEIIVEY